MQDLIAIIFDFDDTLAPDTTTTFLANLGVDVQDFWHHRVQARLDQGWDPIPAYLFELVELSRARPPGERITRDRLIAWGQRLDLYPAAADVFAALQQHVATVNPELRLEFYCLSSGLREILLHTPVAAQFADVWGCEYHCNEAGEITFPKSVVSFTDKTRFLFQISKGQVGAPARRDPFIVNRRVPGERLRIPFRQMIVVGDGYTDVPCFSLVRRYGGVAIGVFDPADESRWTRAWRFVEEQRVSNLVPVDYRKGSGLYSTLMMATQSIAQRITLQQRTFSE